jgi:membrane associated rhomboid family serine protease
MLLPPETTLVGASGGIFGLIGACLSDIIINWKLLFCDFVTENGKRHRHAMVVVFLLLDIALNSIIGLTPYVDNFTRKYKETDWSRRGILISVANLVFLSKQTWVAWHLASCVA